jgi:hypothetical protein
VISPVSTAAQMIAPSPGGRQRLAGALGVDPGHDLCRLGHGRLEMRVARTKGIEDHGAVGQQVFHALPAKADRLGKHAQRIGLGDVRDRIDLLARDELIDKFLGRFFEPCAQARHRLCRKCTVHHRSTARMEWRVGLED